MKCPHCGNQNPIHQQYCATCGKKIEVAFDAVADSVRDDAEKIRERAYPNLLLQVVLLLALANIAVLVVTSTLSPRIDSGDVILPGALPPELSYDAEAVVKMPELPGADEVAPFALPTSVQKGARRFGFRNSPLRERIHAARGGDPAVLKSIQKGLVCLKRRQDRTGAWNVRGGWNLGKAAWGIPAVTGLAVLAMLGDGHVWTGPGGDEDDFGQAAGKGVRYLVSVQQDNGLVGNPEGNYMYNHAIATNALCEAYAMSGVEQLRPPAEKAIAFLLMAQRENGGWDYTEKAGIRANLAVTTWPIAALRSARLAGLKVPDTAFTAAASYIDSLTDPETGFSGYDRRAQGEILSPTFLGSTAMSLACKAMLGQKAGATVCRLQRDVLLREENLPVYKSEWRRVSGTYSERNIYYYFYHGTVGMQTNEGSPWHTWYGAVSKTLLKVQMGDGSWQPIGKWAVDGGRVYTTAMAVLALQTPYRFQ